MLINQCSMDKAPDVSIVIPCYNSERFVSETVLSALNQSYQNIEIIFVDDGSTDDSAKIVSGFNDPRITILKKNNTGVSDSRNCGFNNSTGEYVLFLDADDIISPDFLEKRIQHLKQHPEHSFCFSTVIKIDEIGDTISSVKVDGAGINSLQEILRYDLHFVTCPSNYLFRRKTLTDHAIKFDVELSSSADRFFLIELSRYASGAKINEGGHLLYRVHKNSMSNYLNMSLLLDNQKFQKKVLELDYIPKELINVFSFKTNYIFAGSYYKLGKAAPFLFFLFKAFYYNPVELLKRLLQNK